MEEIKDMGYGLDFHNDVIMRLDRIEKMLNPIVKINKELRVDIKKALSHGKPPRKQPDGSAWKKKKAVFKVLTRWSNKLEHWDKGSKLIVKVVREDIKNFKKEHINSNLF